jgi:hypothetical protein
VKLEKLERWGSTLVQEKNQEEMACDMRRHNNNNNNNRLDVLTEVETYILVYWFLIHFSIYPEPVPPQMSYLLSK